MVEVLTLLLMLENYRPDKICDGFNNYISFLRAVQWEHVLHSCFSFSFLRFICSSLDHDGFIRGWVMLLKALVLDSKPLVRDDDLGKSFHLFGVSALREQNRNGNACSTLLLEDAAPSPGSLF